MNLGGERLVNAPSLFAITTGAQRIARCSILAKLLSARPPVNESVPFSAIHVTAAK